MVTEFQVNRGDPKIATVLPHEGFAKHNDVRFALTLNQANPFRRTSTEVAKSNGDLVPSGKMAAYGIGFRNGALWSLILAVPTVFAIYGKFTIGKSFQFDPATGTSKRINLSPSDVLSCSIAALIFTATVVTLPWATVAGFVKMRRSINDKANCANDRIGRTM